MIFGWMRAKLLILKKSTMLDYFTFIKTTEQQLSDKSPQLSHSTTGRPGDNTDDN